MTSRTSFQMGCLPGEDIEPRFITLCLSREVILSFSVLSCNLPAEEGRGGLSIPCRKSPLAPTWPLDSAFYEQKALETESRCESSTFRVLGPFRILGFDCAQRFLYRVVGRCSELLSVWEALWVTSRARNESSVFEFSM